ncbi:Uncharacterized protein FWK35_00026235, partial [Aphis craccivora]
MFVSYVNDIETEEIIVSLDECVTVHNSFCSTQTDDYYQHEIDRLQKLLKEAQTLSTLRSWACKFSVDQGILYQVLSLLKAKGESMSRNDKITVISFDETSISRKICYDKGKDQIIGPHKCVQVVMAIGKGLVSSLAKFLYVGFEVVALVSDMGPTNIGLWKSLNITPSSPSFINPVTLKNIHVFADVPHLLKLIRNHFIDRGFAVDRFKTINDWFDLSNTQLPIDGFTKSYGLDLDVQNQTLDKVNTVMKDLKVHGSNRRLPFQTGMVGANNHITPMEFKYSLRWYLLGKHFSAVFTEHRNTQDTDEESLVNCLIASTIQNANILNNDDLSITDDITDSTLAVIENDYGNFENELLAKNNPQIDDCIEYVTRSVARKFIHKYHDLGEKLGNPDKNVQSSWTEYINKGYLIKPSAKLIEAATILETIFNDFHT